jgi:recombination protein RecA
LTGVANDTERIYSTTGSGFPTPVHGEPRAKQPGNSAVVGRFIRADQLEQTNEGRIEEQIQMPKQQMPEQQMPEQTSDQISTVSVSTNENPAQNKVAQMAQSKSDSPSKAEQKADQEKDRALSAALAQIERQFGKGSMMRLGDKEQVAIPAISTGSLGLDIALGIGGLPKGRVVEIYGPESSGKTTLTLQVIAEAQKAGGTCAFIDAEHALDPIYAQSLGVDTDNLLVSQPDTGEQALEICDMVVRSGAVDVVVVDSVAALTPRAEIEGEMGDSHVGLQARLMSQALRKMTGNIKQSNTLVIFINQIRMKIGVMFGSPETTTGGNALKFYSSVRLDIRRIGAVKEGDEVTGNETRVKVVKNKVAPPFRQTEFQILYGQGINRMGEILELGVQQGIVEKSGAWYAYKSDRIGQGRKNAADYLAEHPEIREEIESQIRRQLLPDNTTEDEVVIPEPEQDSLS